MVQKNQNKKVGLALLMLISSLGLSDVTMKQKLTAMVDGKTYPMESTIYFQGKNIRMDMKGGASSAVGLMGNVSILSNPSGNYVCMEATKTCNKMPGAFSAFGGAGDPTKVHTINQVSVSGPGKKEKIAGYECVNHTVVKDGQKAEGCYSKAAFSVFSAEALATGKEAMGKIAGNEAARKALLQEFDLGVPLKFEQQMMKMEVVSLQQGAVAAALFQMPKGYQVAGSETMGIPPDALKQLKNLQKNGSIPPEVMEQMKQLMPQGQ